MFATLPEQGTSKRVDILSEVHTCHYPPEARRVRDRGADRRCVPLGDGGHLGLFAASERIPCLRVTHAFGDGAGKDLGVTAGFGIKNTFFWTASGLVVFGSVCLRDAYYSGICGSANKRASEVATDAFGSLTTSLKDLTSLNHAYCHDQAVRGGLLRECAFIAFRPPLGIAAASRGSRGSSSRTPFRARARLRTRARSSRFAVGRLPRLTQRQQGSENVLSAPRAETRPATMRVHAGKIRVPHSAERLGRLATTAERRRAALKNGGDREMDAVPFHRI